MGHGQLAGTQASRLQCLCHMEPLRQSLSVPLGAIGQRHRFLAIVVGAVVVAVIAAASVIVSLCVVRSDVSRGLALAECECLCGRCVK